MNLFVRKKRDNSSTCMQTLYHLTKADTDGTSRIVLTGLIAVYSQSK